MKPALTFCWPCHTPPCVGCLPLKDMSMKLCWSICSCVRSLRLTLGFSYDLFWNVSIAFWSAKCCCCQSTDVYHHCNHSESICHCNCTYIIVIMICILYILLFFKKFTTTIFIRCTFSNIFPFTNPKYFLIRRQIQWKAENVPAASSSRFNGRTERAKTHLGVTPDRQQTSSQPFLDFFWGYMTVCRVL